MIAGFLNHQQYEITKKQTIYANLWNFFYWSQISCQSPCWNPKKSPQTDPKSQAPILHTDGGHPSPPQPLKSWQSKNPSQVIQAVPFSSPIVGGHDSPLERVTNHHPKKVTDWITRSSINNSKSFRPLKTSALLVRCLEKNEKDSPKWWNLWWWFTMVKRKKHQHHKSKKIGQNALLKRKEGRPHLPVPSHFQVLFSSWFQGGLEPPTVSSPHPESCRKKMGGPTFLGDWKKKTPKTTVNCMTVTTVTSEMARFFS